MNFKSYANYYDCIYKNKFYKNEIKFVSSVLKFKKNKSYFDYGCGTFEHSTKLLNKVKKIVGIDSSNSMIKISLSKIKAIKKVRNIQTKVEIYNKNIIDFKYQQKLNGGYSLFHVFSYLRTNRQIKKFFLNLKNNLKPKALFFFDYWYLPSLISQGVRNSKKLFICKKFNILKIVNSKNKKNNVVEINYEFKIFKKNKLVKKFKEKHILRAFELSEIKNFIKRDFKIIKHYQGFVNKKPSQKNLNCSTLIMKK